MAVFVTLRQIMVCKTYTGAQRNGRIALVIAAYTCSTIHAAVNWVFYSNAIDNNELPGGPGLMFSLSHLSAWIEGVGDTFFCINIFMADWIFIWRCWIIWGRRWLIVLLPVAATITGAVLAGIVVSDQVILAESSEALTVAKKSAHFVKFSTIYFSMSIATSLTTTLLIIWRIVLLRRNYEGPRKSLLEIPVESAILYSVTLLAFLALDVEKNTNAFYAQNIHAQMAGLAPMSGYSRPPHEWDAAAFRGGFDHMSKVEGEPASG
ncbi:hypothetical protein FB45DRAFT_993337 [Roridomyces roridus]|uniref:Uncharacterized protein n=1 Tax=Roridomyces roridus TaxID=1738132 RepID=A0AAD7B684_9AGAR|nr:hypothetical protein FB45DRAFT_993337 [Roridomyces roridus]